LINFCHFHIEQGEDLYADVKNKWQKVQLWVPTISYAAHTHARFFSFWDCNIAKIMFVNKNGSCLAYLNCLGRTPFYYSLTFKLHLRPNSIG